MSVSVLLVIIRGFLKNATRKERKLFLLYAFVSLTFWQIFHFVLQYEAIVR